MSRVFLITDVAPPSPKGRAEKVSSRVRVLRANGLSPYVLVPKDLTIHSWDRNVIEVEYPWYAKHPLAGTSIESKILRRVGFPDEHWRWIVPALKALRDRKAGSSDVVISMSNPVSNHMVGYLAKKKYRVKWIADFRDPWVPYKLGRRPFPALQRKTERMVCTSADKVVVYKGYQMNEEYFETTYGLPRENVLRYGYVGFDSYNTPSVWRRRSLRLVYAGSFYPPAITPIKLLTMFKAFLMSNPDVEVTVHFYGMWRREYANAVGRLGLEGYVISHGYRPHSEVTIALSQALAGLVIIPELASEMGSIPSKVFDYIGIGVPMLVVTPSESTLARLVRKTRVGLCASDSDGFASALLHLIQAPPVPAPHVKEMFDRNIGEQRLARAVTQISDTN